MRPRIPIREIPCSHCGTVFGQTQYEKERNTTSCPPCRMLVDRSRERGHVPKDPKNTHFLEIVLPKTMTPHFDKVRQDWYMKVRTRRRRSGEPLVVDRVHLGVGKDADPETVQAAFNAAWARMEMSGMSKYPAETLKKKWTKVKRSRADDRSWKQGKDRDLGVSRHIVKSVVFKAYLYDPLVDGKKHYVGKFNTRVEARRARDAKYKELQRQIVPCACCGALPVWKNSHISHFSSTCPNRVQMPIGVRPLYQAKLWNLRYSTGEIKDAGKLSLVDLYCAGFFYKPVRGINYKARTVVEFDFSLAKNYLRKRPVEKPVEPSDDEIGFE